MRSRLVGVVALIAPLAIGVASAQIPVGQTADGQQIYKPGEGVSYPTLIRQEQPRYTANARRAGIKGAVELEAVVLPDGTVGEVRVAKSLDRVFGLDQEAVTAARKWLFRPGTREGKPVAVLVTLVLEFRFTAEDPQTIPPRSRYAAQTEPEDEFVKGAYSIKTPGLVVPKVIKHVAPKYSSEALRAKIEGIVEVQVVIMEDGSVGRARVLKPLDPDYGLNEAALAASRRSRFEPGLLNGKPVPVVVTMIQEFRIH